MEYSPRPFASGKTLDVQQEQVLQRRDAGRLHGVFGEALVAPHLVAEFRQCGEIRLGQRGGMVFHRRVVRRRWLWEPNNIS